MHRARLARTDRLDRKSPVERLLERVVKHPNGCWNYHGYLDAYGYGRLRINGKKILTHRAIYKEYYGPIPNKKMVCHSCDNPACVNPNHLWLGTAKDNYNDAVHKGRINPIQRAKNRWIKCPTFRKINN
jgi:hypothetical protein